MTSQRDTSRKNNVFSTALSLQHNLPARKKIIGTSDILHHEVKSFRPTDPFLYRVNSDMQIVTRENSSGAYTRGRTFTEFVRMAWTFYNPFSSIPLGFVSCDSRVLTGLPDSTLDLYKRSLFTKGNIVSKKAGSLERTAIVHNLMQQRSKTLWVL